MPSLMKLDVTSRRKWMSYSDVHVFIHGCKPFWFSKLVCTRIYAYIARQPEYGHAINRFTRFHLQALEEAQDICVRRIYGIWGKISTNMLPHISKQLLMLERVCIIHVWFLFSFFILIKRYAACVSIVRICGARRLRWHLLSHIPKWNMTPSTSIDPDTGLLKLSNDASSSKICVVTNNAEALSCCRMISLGPILWLSMSKSERSCRAHWDTWWQTQTIPQALLTTAFQGPQILTALIFAMMPINAPK